MNKNRNKNAVALVGVLWIVVLLTAIIATVARSSRLDVRMAVYNAEKVKAKWACRAGLEFAIAVLDEDERDSDSLIDRWHEHEGDFNEVIVGDCIVDINLVDVCGRLNINTAEASQLKELDYMSDTILDSILDWRDKDDDVRENGAEEGYYSEVEPSYVIRNGYFRTDKELLAVRDIDEAYLYGDDTGWAELLTCYSREKNQTSDSSERVNINKAKEDDLVKKLELKKPQAKWIIEKRPKKDGYKSVTDLIDKKSPKKNNRPKGGKGDKAQQLDIETFRKIVDKITVTDDKFIWGKVNVNTASEEVLRMFFEDDIELARTIVDGRNENYVPMDSIGDLLDIEGMTIDKFKKFGSRLTTRSDVYKVVASSKSKGLGLKFKSEAVIDRGGDQTKIIFMNHGMLN